MKLSNTITVHMPARNQLPEMASSIARNAPKITTKGFETALVFLKKFPTQKGAINAITTPIIV
jgi:hypothetical protein